MNAARAFREPRAAISAAPMLFSVWHTSWTVSDLDRSIAFYRDLLGLELVETKVTPCRESRA